VIEVEDAKGEGGVVIEVEDGKGEGGAHVGEFRKTHHPRNIKFDKVLEICFSGTGNSQFSEAWDL
jgi:hypothetical protein